VGKTEEKPKKILVIDDDPGIIMTLEAGLKARGYAASAAMNSRDGLKKAREDLPDLIVLDVLLPETSGYEVIAELKSDPTTKSIPVIMLTVKKLDEDVAKGLALGADDYVIKPVHTGLFLKRVENLLKRK